MRQFIWELCFNCRLRCGYCHYSSGGWDDLSRLDKTRPGTAEMICGWEKISASYGECRIHLEGGEPLLMPGLDSLLYGLSRLHRVQLTTSLSEEPEMLLRGLPPDRLEIVATLHPQYMAPGLFFERIIRLKAAGFSCRASYLAHPLQLREMAYYRKKLLGLGILMTPVLFEGTFNGMRYPEAYDVKMKRLIEYVSSIGASAENGRYPYSDGSLETGKPAVSPDPGRCYFVGISGELSVREQGKSVKLGNIFAGGKVDPEPGI